ncbi:MAG: phosphoribosylanthranilate isomerase [bacterium]|nr:phosphoribosylanthranilate isomerase [bacterium]
MHRTTSPRVKICCIRSVEEAWTAIRYGASALGLVSEMPSGPGVISEDLIREIATAIPPPVASFLLTSLEDSEEIIEQQRRCGTNTIQICDRLKFGSHRDLRRALPGISIVQVVHVTGEQSIDDAFRISHEVDAILLDSGSPQLPIKELGGTGRVHDWSLSSRIRAAVDVPVFLAGGLKPDNVAEAVRRVGPFGVDLCSGLRTDGMLDESKVRDLFQVLGRS